MLPIPRIPTLALAVLGAWLALAAPAGAVPCDPGRCQTFDVPGAGGSVVAGADGNAWFSGDGYIGRMDRAGNVTRFSAPASTSSPLAAGPDGALYFTTPETVGRMTTDGQYTLARTGLAGVAAIAPGPGGSMWLGATGGVVEARVSDLARAANVAGGDVQASAARSSGGPSMMVRGPDGALWFVEANQPAIGRMAADGSVTDFPLPPEFAGEVAGLVSGPDGGIWFTAPKGFRVGRLSMKGEFISFRTSWNPYAIAAGPSLSLWFAMTDRGRWTVVRLVTAGYMTFWQVPGPVTGIGAGPDGAIYISRPGAIERVQPFLGAYPIRGRALLVNPYAGSVTMRFYCPQLDLVYCAGTVTLRYHGRVVGTVPFSQRANDAPSTRMILNAYGRRLTRHARRFPVTATLSQHDAGGSWRQSTYAFELLGAHK
jgi:virginiamycin B lyase